MELVLLRLGKAKPGDLHLGSFVRGVLLAGNIKTQHELNGMSPDAQRNTLIFMLTSLRATNPTINRSVILIWQGMGVVLVFLREAKIRTDFELKNMSADDRRNVAIVEIGSQTNLGSKLQGLGSMDLVRLALGVAPEIVFELLCHRLSNCQLCHFFTVDSIEVVTQKADGDHSYSTGYQLCDNC